MVNIMFIKNCCFIDPQNKCGCSWCGFGIVLTGKKWESTVIVIVAVDHNLFNNSAFRTLSKDERIQTEISHFPEGTWTGISHLEDWLLLSAATVDNFHFTCNIEILIGEVEKKERERNYNPEAWGFAQSLEK